MTTTRHALRQRRGRGQSRGGAKEMTKAETRMEGADDDVEEQDDKMMMT